MRLAIIPARGGSKRIPRKNIRNLAGLPAIAWPIRSALAAGRFEMVVVSTDDEEIAEVARQHGATVPFLRPAHLSDDVTGTRQVIQHAIAELVSLNSGLTRLRVPPYTALKADPYSPFELGLQ